MTAIPDAIILFIVYALAGLYVATVHSWHGRSRGVDSERVTGSERLGLSVVLGVLLLAVANNYLSALLGSFWTAVALLVLPAGRLVFVTVRREWSSSFGDLRASLWRDLAGSIVCALFILSAAHKLFFWRSLSALGFFHLDLPWHIGRASAQAFQSVSGSWPLSPLAFPAPLPFVSFVADSLASATFRYLPISIHGFTYSQVLFCWSMVLWTAVVLTAGSGPRRALVVLITAILAVPAFLFGIRGVGDAVFVFFLANPNSLTTWPIGLALAFHLYQSFRRNSTPSLLVLALVPPASVFFKANQAFSFGFLQAVGIGIVLSSGRYLNGLKLALYAAGIWAAAILASLAMGPWPISTGVHPSIANLKYYARAAVPDTRSLSSLAVRWLTYLLIVGVVCAAPALARAASSAPRTAGTIGRQLQRDVGTPLAVLTAAMVYLAVGWWAVAPSGLAEGEPMHVNFELIMWLMTVFIAGAVHNLYSGDPAGRRWGGVRLRPVALSAIGVGLSGFMMWNLNGPSARRWANPVHPDYDITVERDVRDAAKQWIPDGNCFGFGRRYAMYVSDPYDPDMVIAATGCPVINGRRWRGYLGDNRPDRVREQATIAVGAGGPFGLIEIGDSLNKQQIADLKARIGRGVPISGRAELMALPRAAATDNGFDYAALRRVLDRTEDGPDIREPLALLRAVTEGRSRVGSEGPDVIRAGGGVVTPADMHGDATLEGFTVRPLPNGEREVRLYFTPRRIWHGRRLWMHAYPQGSHEYALVDPVAPTFDDWKLGELSWEAFRLPANTHYVVYVGVEVNHDLGPAYPLGPIP